MTGQPCPTSGADCLSVIGPPDSLYCSGSGNLQPGRLYKCEAPPPPTGCPTIGNVCSDGSVYAGLSPDGNVKMYTTATRSPTKYGWDAASSGATGMILCDDYNEATCTTGESNTNFLIGISATSYPAASYCSNLSAHGQTDWYLPSYDETSILFDNFSAIGGFPNSDFDSVYWSSSEFTSLQSLIRRINSNSSGSASMGKSSSRWVRCVRR